ncbi:hypothetical protein [Microbacterium hominis]|uniref:Uncharacterized protein n=1 Tax=Microbacterium hominis TaxID=162426 RepID=A0A7D4UAW8_9MICO|nr:hypothetical protein [Microbacterium hominis]QKJ18863.1 hypothetical protein HQM25_05345 [Microbacterium hominis]
MSRQPPEDQTPDEQRTARDARWARTTSMHWRTRVPTAPTSARADEYYEFRATKPTEIPSQSPRGPERPTSPTWTGSASGA